MCSCVCVVCPHSEKGPRTDVDVLSLLVSVTSTSRSAGVGQVEKLRRGCVKIDFPAENILQVS